MVGGPELQLLSLHCWGGGGRRWQESPPKTAPSPARAWASKSGQKRGQAAGRFPRLPELKPRPRARGLSPERAKISVPDAAEVRTERRDLATALPWADPGELRSCGDRRKSKAASAGAGIKVRVRRLRSLRAGCQQGVDHSPKGHRPLG